jgi:hypothetical protein
MSEPSEARQPDHPNQRQSKAAARREKRRRAMQALALPSVSGKMSALAMFLCLALSAGLAYLLSAPLHLPVWVRWEIVVGAWWLVWLLALAHMLYWGKRLSDDHRMGAPRSWFGGGSRGSSGGGSGWNLGPVDFQGTGEGCGEGCATVLAVIVAVIAVVAAAWLIIEVIIPALAFLLYVLIRGMLARVVNDRHACTGHLGRSLLWGSAWATAYAAPLAGLIWLGHYLWELMRR